MAKTLQANPESQYQRDVSNSIEAAVKRLMENGATRRDALNRIEKALSDAVFALGAVGIGSTAHLRRQMLTVGVKIEADRQQMVGGEVKRDGI
jgi:hypothetical protein